MKHRTASCANLCTQSRLECTCADLTTLHSSQRLIVVTSPKTIDACGVEVYVYHDGGKV